MKRFAILLPLLPFVMLAGCVTLPLTTEREEQGFETFYLKVTSNPFNAQVYINDRLVGSTPGTVPLEIKYYETVYPLWRGAPFTKGEHYILRVSKKGYIDAVTPIERGWTLEQIKARSSRTMPPVKEEYHFELEKEEGKDINQPSS